MDVRYRGRVLCLGSCALLFACTINHSNIVPVAGAGAAGNASPAAEGGKGGGESLPRDQPKPGKSGVPGTKAIAKLEPVGEAAEDPTNALRGTATFSVSDSGVDLAILLQHCTRTSPIDVFIQAGRDCAEETLSGPHWDGQRGEDLPMVSCILGSQGRAAYTRGEDLKKSWSIGGSDASNILSHAIVAYDASGVAIACGVIGQDESTPPAPPVDPKVVNSVPLLGRAQIAGLCLAGLLARDTDQPCPDPQALTDCAQEHCQLDACIAICRDYLACTTTATDPCSVAYTCDVTQACSTCQSDVQQCMFSFCADQITCPVPVTPDGPCSKLRACCELQGDMAQSCLDAVAQIEKLSGDASCMGLMNDAGFFAHLPVSCMFE